MNLNENIEVIAVEGIAQSRALLALKGLDINSDGATCLSVLLRDTYVEPMKKINLIALETKFNAYQFLNERQRLKYLAKFKRMLNDRTTKEINDLLMPKAE